MWRPTRYTDEDFAAFREGMEDSRLQAVMIHMIYLINPATKDKEMRKKSLASLTHALRSARGSGAIGVVVHPGALKEDTRANAKKRAIKLIKEALARDRVLPDPLREHRRLAPAPRPRLRRDRRADREDRRARSAWASASTPATCTRPGYDVRTPRGRGRARRRDRRQDRPRAAEGHPPERLPRRARLQPRPPRRDRQGRDRPQGLPRLPLGAPLPGAARGLGDAGARTARARTARRCS